jgi:hypothetical protein
MGKEDQKSPLPMTSPRPYWSTLCSTFLATPIFRTS